MLDDEYLDLVVSAHAALRELLDASEHDAWGFLRSGYGELRRALGSQADKARRAETQARAEELRAERIEARRVWRGLSAAARESLLLQALGDDRLLLRELTLRMNAALGYAPDHHVSPVYDVHTRYLAAKMVRAGQLDRMQETFNGARVRNRYRRKRAMTGPIVDLERAYRELEPREGVE